MIDTDLRAELSKDIRRLATGRMPEGEFDELFHDCDEMSHDPAIEAIVNYCYCAYMDNVLHLPEHILGQYAREPNKRRTIARCVLFLRSGNEYKWPRLPNNSICITIATPLGFLAVALTLIGLWMAISHPDAFAIWLTAISLPLSALCFWFGFLQQPTVSTDDWQKFTAAGDYDYWPFLKRESFDDARSHIHVLGR